jgi:hypothetical protein
MSSNICIFVFCRELVPKTCTFMKETFNKATTFKYGVIKVSALTGKTRILPHEGMTNLKLRIVLPIRIPEGFKFRLAKDTFVDLVEGKYVVIDDSFEHELVNESDETAIWMTIDIPHPDMKPDDHTKLNISAFSKSYYLI